jgi:hypothetical protein
MAKKPSPSIIRITERSLLLRNSLKTRTTNIQNISHELDDISLRLSWNFYSFIHNSIPTKPPPPPPAPHPQPLRSQISSSNTSTASLTTPEPTKKPSTPTDLSISSFPKKDQIPFINRKIFNIKESLPTIETINTKLGLYDLYNDRKRPVDVASYSILQLKSNKKKLL